MSLDHAVSSVSGVETDIAKIRAALDVHVWKGPGALQDRATLLLVLSKAERAGRIHNVNVSVREVSGATDCALSTASDSLARLTTAGWIAPGSNNYDGSVRVPSRGWNLIVPRVASPVGTLKPWDPTGITPFVASGLGRAAGYVYETLTPEPISAAQLAAKLNRTKRRIHKHLTALEAFGLAQRTVKGWTRGEEDPASVAKELGIPERLQRRRERYAQDSRIFQAGRPPRRVVRSDGTRVRVDLETGEILER